ncbi:FAD/NAD(P)-binding protein [Rhodococcus sp. BP-252]|uniref:FAD/NAD(P)-binding protein n=1 Tax=unclassified Rhodococcus (in: high G+C Gram-positive bacteria) TaxID=192944 RepID=UPI001C9B3056|nr:MULTISPECIES: FAD/NAD(P)-binding protein [unclassified Rhodococcus (in: high G+C Gram-positive bacteria)]MBY6412519.1 FAD/NAD(P)-binding protein [Rhodococcus sp. BP-320]MBY6417226.1 FAD/NAD(P)-binding protein [Rhodococcus sp. BP-321]MBY6424151.1 FAD/NAD(P)-binding protein [Rhodococcus sp. BP-324]MBY6427250.1 FAD/NAD(P)-binding protein [Rhodococcus sp. BP-323]MBY6432137.1 FAD/NAD(P)-binding protein [Rhodococcus sp. BP-322]
MTSIPEQHRIAIVGAGPRGTGMLERLLAHLADTDAADTTSIHIVDPFPAGAGRIWRGSQPPLLWMNSVAADVTMFTDETTTVDGPIKPGPTLAEWVLSNIGTLKSDPEVASELEMFTAQSFASRTLQSRYLEWVFAQAVTDAPATVDVHRSTVVDIADSPDGSQTLTLDDGSTLDVDVVVLAQGHPDALPSSAETYLQKFADSHDLTYVGPGYTADLDPDVVPSDEPILVAGLGLAFIDWMVLLAESRGGVFSRGIDGDLIYEPSGREPIVYAGSRRGVPYHSKIGYDIAAARPPLPKYFTADAFPGDGWLDFRRDVWPLAAKELAGAHFHELFASHPERITGEWADFDARFAALEWGSDEARRLVEAFVPKDDDRIDLDLIDRPLTGESYDDVDDATARIIGYIDDDLARRADHHYSSDAAVFSALLSVYMTTGELLRRGRIPAASVAMDIEGWLHSFFSFVASGPPPQRLEQLRALASCGVVRFLGPDTTFSADTTDGVFVAQSAAHPEIIMARTLVDARLPVASIRSSGDALLRTLHSRGEMVEIRANERSAAKISVDGRSRIIKADGSVHEQRYAVGPWVAGHNWSSAFPRPQTNAGFFRHNDALALELLR